MRLAFDHPLWLFGLLVVPLIVWAGLRRGGPVAAVRPRQQRAATWLRATAIALLVLALAAPRWASAGRDVDVAFLVDVSDSVGGNQHDARDWVDAAIAAKPEGDRATLAVFGRDARLEYTLRPDPPTDEFATVVDASATDLSRALRLAQGALGSQQRRRVVLITDGRETSGDALAAAEELAVSGVAVDVVPIASGQRADVLVESVHAPSRVREGDAFDVTGVIRNTGGSATDVVVVVEADGSEVHRESVSAAPGRTEVTVPQVADRTGTVRYQVRLASGASSITANDVAYTAVQVDGPARVLVYEHETGAGSDIEAALEAASVPADRSGAEQAPLPPLDRLLDYDAVVLVDVPVSAIGEQGMVTLDAYVRDAGRGLVTVGGDDSYGMGGYDTTPLEDLLPVFARVKDPKRRPSVAEALVVDVSGSMAACHCRADGFGGGPGMSEEGGINKTDISKEAVARAVRALEAQDLVGVLAFNANARWVLPLQSLPSDAVVDDALAKLHPNGETNVPGAIREAITALKDANARLRHIVLFTDGFSENPDMLDVAREAAEAGITLSVVATGEGTGEVLRRMAEAGGGRYYPGRDLMSIPDIIVSEVQFAARPIINEGSFLPVVTGIAPATEDLSETPPLLGYLATTAKPTARTLLQIGEERDPLLATWQAGLGTVTAWTSDATDRWSAGWVSWERFSQFWADVVKATLPADPDPSFAVSATTDADRIEVTVDAAEVVSGDVTGLATVTLPDGSRVEVPLERTDLATFSASVPGGGEGVHAVSVQLSRGDTAVFHDTVTAIRSYSTEYALDASNVGLAERIAEAGGGRFDPAPESAFAAEGLEPGEASRELWPWLALLALLLLPADVGLRRLRLERGDLGRVGRWFVARWRGRRAPAERRESTEGLIAAKRRARERLTAERPTPDRSGDHPSPDTGSSAPVDEGAATPAPPEPPRDGGPEPQGSAGAAGLLDARRRARGTGDDEPHR
ncbi:MAG: VWA domain-containing protein [Actinobacteria bacterium]|nr:VWA domain-containing protein [Actinomycetota bacterium]